MAIAREIDYSDTYLTYLSTIAFFCGISCTIVMIRFKGFKASLNLSSGKSNGKHYEVAPQTSVVGAYRTSREEYFGNINYLETRKPITPSMVKLPPNAESKAVCPVKPSKSTGDLTTLQNVPAEVRKSTPIVNVQNPSVGTKEAKNQLKTQKKLEKEQQNEQKKREKLAAQERDKEQKLRKEREKKAAEQEAREAKEREKQRKRKGAAPQPQQQTTTQQTGTSQQKPIKTDQGGQRPHQKREAPPPPQFKKVTQRVQPSPNPVSQTSAQNSRNSLESSISRSSGPPPYSDTNETDKIDTGNISFVKPAQVPSSWDMISQHRQQMSRTAPATVHSSKQKTMDLRYNVTVTNNDRDNSEA